METGYTNFLLKNLSRLPSNFRVFTTSRLEDASGIESAFVGAPSVRTKHMDDLELAAKTHDDILAFLQEKLLLVEFNRYGNELAKRAKGLFQWAAVECGYILKPPGSFGFSKKKCVEHLLRLSADYHEQDPIGRAVQRSPRSMFYTRSSAISIPLSSGSSLLHSNPSPSVP